MNRLGKVHSLEHAGWSATQMYESKGYAMWRSACFKETTEVLCSLWEMLSNNPCMDFAAAAEIIAAWAVR